MIRGQRRSAATVAVGAALLAAVTVPTVAGCGGEAAQMRPLPVPTDGSARERAIEQAGRRIYAALRDNQPVSLLADDVTLRSLCDAQAASRYTALRLGVSGRVEARPEELAALRGADFGGICLQGVRLEPGGSPLGLLSDGWIFDRALITGLQPGGRRVAAWVEGTFVYTPSGFVALDLTRVEAPRWEHSDLELAPCDMEVRAGAPQDVVLASP